MGQSGGAAQARMDQRSVIEACRRGERDAFRTLFETYKERVYSIAFHYLDGDEAAAKDVTQQVFLKLMTGIGQFRQESEFSTWLYRLVVNACLDGRRRGRRWVLLDSVAALAHRWDGRSQEQEVLESEKADSVRAAVAGLTPKLRLAILLRYFDELSYEQMAAALGCSAGTVASRLNRGHKLLARQLAHFRSGAPDQGGSEGVS